MIKRLSIRNLLNLLVFRLIEKAGIVVDNDERCNQRPQHKMWDVLFDVEPFHTALVEIGAKAGENMTFKNKEKTHVQGDILLVTVTWEGAEREYDLDEVITDSNRKQLIKRLGGNLPVALKKRTGCLLCLDSCPVGIVSNFTYTYGAVEKRGEVSFMGNRNLLPPNGSVVVIKLKKQKLDV